MMRALWQRAGAFLDADDRAFLVINGLRVGAGIMLVLVSATTLGLAIRLFHLAAGG